VFEPAGAHRPDHQCNRARCIAVHQQHAGVHARAVVTPGTTSSGTPVTTERAKRHLRHIGTAGKYNAAQQEATKRATA